MTPYPIFAIHNSQFNTHAIRAGGALQLAAALIACEERPELLPFVCLDDRLRDAARREGFSVLPP